MNPPQLVQHDDAIGAHGWCPGRTKMVSWANKMVSLVHHEGVRGKCRVRFAPRASRAFNQRPGAGALKRFSATRDRVARGAIACGLSLILGGLDQHGSVSGPLDWFLIFGVELLRLTPRRRRHYGLNVLGGAWLCLFLPHPCGHLARGCR